MLVVDCEQKIPEPRVAGARIISFDGQRYLELELNGSVFHDLVFDSKLGDVVTFRSHSMPDRKISMVSKDMDDIINELTC